MDHPSTKNADSLGQSKPQSARRKGKRDKNAKPATPSDSYASADLASNISGDTESLQSLKSRLGLPPAKLLDDLQELFRQACLDYQANHHALPSADPGRWFLTAQGELVYGPSASGSIAVNESSERDSGSLHSNDVSTVVADFRRRLSSPDSQGSLHSNASKELAEGRSPTASKIETAGSTGSVSNSIGPVTNARQTNRTDGLRQRLDSHHVEETETSGMTDAEQDRRKVLVDQFTRALIERFGEERVQRTPEPVIHPRGLKLKPIERDRKFNWNLVLGVASLAAVIALCYVGFTIANQRKERIANQPRVKQSDTLTPPKAQERVAAKDDDSHLSVDLPSPTESSEDLQSIEPAESFSSNDQVAIGSATSDIQSAIERLTRPEGLPTESTFRPSENSLKKPKSTESILDLLGNTNQTVKQAQKSTVLASDAEKLGGEKPEDVLLNVSQGTADEDPSSPKNQVSWQEFEAGFVELPLPSDSEQAVQITNVQTPLSQLEFPKPYRISLRNEGSTTKIVDESKEQVIAILSGNSSPQFRWTQEGAQSVNSQKLFHGRLIDSSKQPIYLRPALNAQRIGELFTEAAPRRWMLKHPIIRDKTHLDLRFQSESEAIQFRWIQPIDLLSDGKQIGIVEITPTETDLVAIRLQITVSCDRELELMVQWFGRLDPNYQFQYFTKNHLYDELRSRATSRTALLTRIDLLETSLSSQTSSQQRITKADIKAKKQQLDALEPTVERLQTLWNMAQEIEVSTELDLNLYVQWPDDQQTIFKTVGR
ncbi:hypothetical protein LOC67_13850 [Stieleria sp. JC731]|uniref:hypothetical protein n=1 Tax=Pirellulaceae TaxID=2691357 RepID=UPI001E35E24C|nr:hypothetical protein [Stieleria sp. JC731]MCC9601637.1 hypothetical protein [Stieleria sp. JC731]